jgi:DNA polymerase elongation subunit (family B)
LAIKTANNTFFGGLGSDFNPFYKFEISAAITAQARSCLRKLNEAIENLYGNIDGKTRIVANDTDSAFWLSKDVLTP